MTNVLADDRWHPDIQRGAQIERARVIAIIEDYRVTGSNSMIDMILADIRDPKP